MSGASDPPGGFPHGHGKGKGRAVDFDDHSSSHNYYMPYCATCQQPVLNPSNCINDNHDLPGMTLSSSNELPPQMFQNDFQYSDHTDLLTGFSDESGLFSTPDHTGGSSNTGDSFLDIENLPLNEDSLHQEPVMVPNPSNWPNHDHQHMPNAQWYNETQDVQMLDNGQIGLTARQLETLNFWLQRCEREQRRPTDLEVQSIANLEHLSIDAVLSWFQARQAPLPMHPATSHGAPENQAPALPTPPDPDVLSQVSNYAARRAADDSACSNAQSRKAGSDQRYKCTVGCGFSTDDLDTWKRHLRNRYPQNFWHCVLCRGTGRKPFICHRRDKIFQHLHKVHTGVHRSDYDDVRDQSEIQQEGRFPGECPFSNDYCTCQRTFQSWDDFIQHCLEHLNDRIHDGPWLLRFKHRHPDDDDDNANSGPNASSSSHFAVASSSSAGLSRPAKSQSKPCTRYQGTTRPSQQQSVRLEYNPNTAPSCLIDVRRCQVVKTKPPRAKWLALDYSWASERYAQSKLPYNAESFEVQNGDLRRADLPMPFKRAMMLTREMGYRYLWVDVLCEPRGYPQKPEAIYRQAALIIVIVGFEASPDHIWHFTCDFKNLQTVLSWAHDRIWNYTFYQVRNLGHGAYGIVDEVRLQSTQPTQQTFARKACLNRRDGRVLQPRYLQEIEILRKFDHPNIAKFVAAYIQGRSLNILMLPVAECDLRELLARPREWANKLKFLPSWFLSLARAVEYMHNMSCRHKDIKPANILISGEDVLLSDFGTSQDFSASESASSGPGLMTPKYCAPEVAQKKKRGRKADIFSLGCVFLEMITISFRQTLDDLKEHLGFKSNSQDILSVYHEHIPAMHSWLKHLWVLQPSPCQERIIQITARMLDETPSKRPTAREVRKALLPEPLQGKNLGNNAASYHGSGATALHLASATLPIRSRKTLPRSTGDKTLALIKQSHSPQLDVNENTDVLLFWSNLDIGGLAGRSMVSSNHVDRLQYAALSYVWKHEAYNGPLGYSNVDQASFNLEFAAGGLSRATVSVMLVINCSRKEHHMDSPQTLGSVSTPLVATKTTVVVLLHHDTHHSACGTQMIAAAQALLPQSTCNEFGVRSKRLALPCSPNLVSACQGPVAGLGESQNARCLTLAPTKGLRKRSALLSRVLKAIQIMLDGVLLKGTAPDHGNDPDCKDRTKQRLQRLRSVWTQICHGLPTLLTEGASALFPLYTQGNHLWKMLKGNWNRLDGMFAAYERKAVFAILSQKSKMAIIVKRRFQKLMGSPMGGRGTCPQHGSVLDAPAIDCKTQEDPREPLNHERTDHINSGWTTFDATTARSIPTLSITGSALAHTSIDRGSWHPGAAGSFSRPQGSISGCCESALEHEASQELSKPSDLGAASGAFGEGVSPRSMLTSHAGMGSISGYHLKPTSGFASRTDLASEHHWSNDYPSRYRHGDFADQCIEVGDLGFVPMETINRSLARHERCTCHHNELLLPSPASNVEISDVDSDTDSDALSLCSSSQMMPSLGSVSSCTSLPSLGHAEIARPFPLLSDPLRLTTETLEFEFGFIDASEFGEFDLW